MKAGGTMPAVLNAANEVAVAAFLQREIGFNDIPVVINNTMQLHEKKSAVDIDAVVEADRWAREKAREIIKLKIKK
jgi:1-deoxy-D-xylulose-5-phosphate reductoisomerase